MTKPRSVQLWEGVTVLSPGVISGNAFLVTLSRLLHIDFIRDDEVQCSFSLSDNRKDSSVGVLPASVDLGRAIVRF
jgi:hypothetical protein